MHSADVTKGSVHDSQMMDGLIREDDRAIFADKGYANEKKKRAARSAGVHRTMGQNRRVPGRLSITL